MGLRATFGSSKRVAVDYDSRRMRIVCAAGEGDAARVRKLATVDMPAEMDLSDATAVGKFLGKTLRKLHMPRSAVLMSVPRSQAVLKPLTLPPGTPQEELAGMVQYQMRSELPFPPDEAVVDFTVESHFDAEAEAQPQGLEVLVAAVRVGVVEHYRQVAAAAGVKLQRLGIRPYADMRCVDACGARDPEQTAALVHLGADEIEIDVLAGSSLAFTRAAAIKTAADDAAARLRQTGMEVVRSLQSYHMVERSEAIQFIVVAGGSGVEEQVAEMLSRRLDVPVRVLDPREALGLAETEHASGFISALGLAIGARADALPFDFLSPKRPVVRRDTRKLKRTLLAAAAGVLLIAGAAMGYRHLDAKQRRNAATRERLRKLKKLNDADRTVLRHRKRLRAWKADVRRWAKHLASISYVAPDAEHLHIDGLSTRSDQSFSFTVRATTSNAVAEFIDRLTRFGYRVSPGRTTYGTGDFGYDYTCDMTVEVPADLEVDLEALGAVERPEDDISATLSPREAQRAFAKRPAPQTGDRPVAKTDDAEKPEPRADYEALHGPKKYQRTRFNELTPGAPGRTAFDGDPVYFRARVGEQVETFHLDRAPAGHYVACKLTYEGASGHVIGYLLKGARPHKVLQYLQKNPKRAGTLLRIHGTAWHHGKDPAAPVAVVVDSIKK